MFKRITQPGLLSIFDADYENPLKLWDKRIRDGQIKRTVTDDVKGLVLEMSSKIPMNSYINCPASSKQILGIQYPFFHVVLKLPFTTFFAFDVQVLDDKSIRRRFRVSTTQTFVEIHPFLCKLPLALENGWNRITIPLHHFVKDIYGTTYVHTLRVAMYPNCLLKKVFFSDREYYDEDIPAEFHIEDADPSDNYRLKYTALVAQKRKSSLSYYPDLIHGKVNKTSCLINTKEMTKDLPEKPFLFLLHSHQKRPLRLWDKKIRAGYIYQVVDQEIQSAVLELVSLKSSRTYITCPADPRKILGIQAPFLHFVVKNLQRSVAIDVLIKDNKNVKRRFRAMTKQMDTQVKPYVCKMPLMLENGWNKIVVPLNDYTLKAYGTKYAETLRVQIHATCRVQGIFFSHNHNTDDRFSTAVVLSEEQGFLSLLHNIGSKPLLFWDKKIRAGHIARVADDDLCTYVIELVSFTPKNTYITCPENQSKTLGIRLPVLNITVKNLDEPFSFGIQIMDSKSTKRRFSFSTDLQYTLCKPLLCMAPLTLQPGWNEISLNLQELTRKVFKVGYKETLRLQINASCRIKRVFFSGKILNEQDVPVDLRLHNVVVENENT